MNIKPIIVVAGEPFSVFLEIFYKSLKKNNFKKPIILIASKKLVEAQMVKLNYKFKINLLNIYKLRFKHLKKNEINLINVEFKFKEIFDKISDKSNSYIEKCFSISLKILKNNECSGLINGPISKKHFLKGKNLGITEYLANKTKKNNNVAMLIFNKDISVSPITTHLALKDVNKQITKKKLYDHVKLITKFYKKISKRKQGLQ